MDVAYGLTALTAAKLVVYTFGSLIHLFLIVLILGNWRLRRFQILLFGLMTALFMWYAGNLLALNICLSYGAGPVLLSGFAGTVSIIGFMIAVPLLVHSQAEYPLRISADANLATNSGGVLLSSCRPLPVDRGENTESPGS